MSFDQLGKARLKSFSDLVRYLEYKLLGPETGEGEGDRGWTARQAKGTLEAFVRRLRSSVENVAHLVRGDRPGSPPDPLSGKAQVHVVDLAKLSPQAQMFVVGSLLKDLFERKERGQYRGGSSSSWTSSTSTPPGRRKAPSRTCSWTSPRGAAPSG